MYFYSESTCGFYVEGASLTLPDDAKKISEAEYQRLLLGQEQGKRIVVDTKGRPTLADPLPLSTEQQTAAERIWRDAALAATDAVVMRHRDELEDGSATTLTAEQYTQLQAYRRALRAWPESGEFPLSEHRPPAPKWLPSLTP